MNAKILALAVTLAFTALGGAGRAQSLPAAIALDGHCSADSGIVRLRGAQEPDQFSHCSMVIMSLTSSSQRSVLQFAAKSSRPGSLIAFYGDSVGDGVVNVDHVMIDGKGRLPTSTGRCVLKTTANRQDFSEISCAAFFTRGGVMNNVVIRFSVAPGAAPHVLN